LAAFFFLAFFWKIQQRRQTAFLPEFDDIRGCYRGVPKLWEVWIRDELCEKEWNWENTTTTVCFCLCAVQSPAAISPAPTMPPLPSPSPKLLFGGVANLYPYPYPCMIHI